MCGRYTLRDPAPRHWPGVAGEWPACAPRYNIAPGSEVLVLHAATGAPRAVMLHWGWPSPSEHGAAKLLFNARAETAADKPSFREAFRHRRCLIPADGWYEWRHDAGGTKLPHFFRRHDDAPFAFGGLWSHSPGGSAQAGSCVILTTAANALAARVHERMPLIIDRLNYDEWLDPANPHLERLRFLCRPYLRDDLEYWPVSSYVNNSRNDDAYCITPAVHR